MNEPELYQANSGHQRRDVALCLRDFGDITRWKGRDRVVDLGCGDGGVTAGVLRAFLPSDYAQLVGGDVSARMVSYAQAQHADARTTFRELDMEVPLPTHLASAFDHVFSFYALHWIRDQERAFSNIYELLVEGGDCLLHILAHMPIFDVYRAHAALPGWGAYARDFYRRISPYHDLQEPEEEVRNIMSKIGFKNIVVARKEVEIVYETLENYIGFMLSVKPFDVPAELRQQYVRAHLQAVRALRLPGYRLLEGDGGAGGGLGGGGSLTARYSYVVATADK